MSIGSALAAELQYEAVSTRKMLERVPTESFGWQPHEKSMSLGRIASHVAELPQFTRWILTGEELDFATSDFKPTTFGSAEELVAEFDRAVNESIERLNKISDEEMRQTWRLRSGEQIFMEMPRQAFLRSIVLNHLIHHRGQLSVYLRLKDVPLPSVYGPSADEQAF